MYNIIMNIFCVIHLCNLLFVTLSTISNKKFSSLNVLIKYGLYSQKNHVVNTVWDGSSIINYFTEKMWEWECTARPPTGTGLRMCWRGWRWSMSTLTMTPSVWDGLWMDFRVKVCKNIFDTIDGNSTFLQCTVITNLFTLIWLHFKLVYVF